MSQFKPRGRPWLAAAAGVAVVGAALWQARRDGLASPTYLTMDVSVAPELMQQAQAGRTLFFIFTKAAGAGNEADVAIKEAGDTAVCQIWLAYRERLNKPLSSSRRFYFRREQLQLYSGDWQTMPARFKLKVRLDVDGLAGPNQAGDIVSGWSEQQLGATASVVLDTAVVAPPSAQQAAAEGWDALQVWNPRQQSRDQLFGKPKRPSVPAMPQLNHDVLRAFLLDNTGV